MVHIGNPEDAVEAVAAGADTVEHGILPGASSTECPAELVVTMRDRGNDFVPTLCAARAMKTLYPDALRHAMRWVTQTHREGVRIALGADAGAPAVAVGKAAYMELEVLVESGLTPLEAIVDGTSNAAAVIRRAADPWNDRVRQARRSHRRRRRPIERHPRVSGDPACDQGRRDRAGSRGRQHKRSRVKGFTARSPAIALRERPRRPSSTRQPHVQHVAHRRSRDEGVLLRRRRARYDALDHQRRNGGCHHAHRRN